MSTNDLPIGDIRHADEVMTAIEHQLGQQGIDISEVTFRIDRSRIGMSRRAAEEWIKGAKDEGYSDIRFILTRDSASGVEVNLAASSPKTSTTYFREM